MTTFIEAVRGKTATPEQVDDWVDRWHNGEGDGLTLRQFLGLTEQQYAEWMRNPAVLASFID